MRNTQTQKMIRKIAVAAALVCLGTSSIALAQKKRATKDDYELDLKESAKSLKVGDKGEFSLLIKAKNGLKIHPEAPLSLKLTTSDGVNTLKSKLTREDVKKTEGSVDPDLRTQVDAKAKGEQKISGELSFFLCSKEWCERVSDKIEHTIVVE